MGFYGAGLTSGTLSLVMGYQITWVTLAKKCYRFGKIGDYPRVGLYFHHNLIKLLDFSDNTELWTSGIYTVSGRRLLAGGMPLTGNIK